MTRIDSIQIVLKGFHVHINPFLMKNISLHISEAQIVNYFEMQTNTTKPLIKRKPSVPFLYITCIGNKVLF